jgi:hypothetical protein
LSRGPSLLPVILNLLSNPQVNCCGRDKFEGKTKILKKNNCFFLKSCFQGFPKECHISKANLHFGGAIFCLTEGLRVFRIGAKYSQTWSQRLWGKRPFFSLSSL